MSVGPDEVELTVQPATLTRAITRELFHLRLKNKTTATAAGYSDCVVSVGAGRRLRRRTIEDELGTIHSLQMEVQALWLNVPSVFSEAANCLNKLSTLGLVFETHTNRSRVDCLVSGKLCKHH